MESKERFGARIAFMPPDYVLIQQTILSEKHGRHIIHKVEGDKTERHVRLEDDAGIGAAVRLAMQGKLTRS